MSNPTELPDLDNLEALAYELGSISVFQTPHFKILDQASKEMLNLIALARRAQPECEAPQAKRRIPDAECTQGSCARMTTGCIGKCSLSGVNLSGLIVAPAATLSPLCGAQHAESGSIEDYNEFNRLLHAYADEQGDETYRALVSYIDKWADRRAPGTPEAPALGKSLLRPAISATNPLPPGCYCKPGQCAAPIIMGRQTPCRDPAKRAAQLDTAPEAPADLPRLYRFDCYVGKTKMAAGVGVHASTMEEAEQKARKMIDKGETIKFESNRPCHATRKCHICADYERAAQLDGGQEGSCTDA